MKIPDQFVLSLLSVHEILDLNQKSEANCSTISVISQIIASITGRCVIPVCVLLKQNSWGKTAPETTAVRIGKKNKKRKRIRKKVTRIR